jgi:hypothetical protein
MSLPIASTGAATALPVANIHPHGHGHKKGLDSLTDPSSTTATDSSSTAAAQTPAGSTQSLFGSLLSSLEQIIGVQPANGSSQTTAGQTASMGQTNTQVASAVSAVGQVAKSALETAVPALRLFA